MLHWIVISTIALLGGLFVVSRVVSTLFQRIGSGHRATGLALIALELVALGAPYIIIVRADPGQVAASSVGSPLAAVAVNTIVASVAAVAGSTIVVRGLAPAISEHRAGTYTLPDRFRRRRRRALFSVVAALALVAEVIRLGVVEVSGAWILVAIAVAWIALQIRMYPISMVPINGLRVRDPTEDERERIENCYERFGRSPGRVVIAADAAAIDANAAGRGEYHTVGITEQFLARVDDTTLAVTLAQADERSATGYWTAHISYIIMSYLMLWLIVFAGPAFLLEIFTTSIPQLWFVMPLLVLLTMPPLAWLGRRRVYGADAFVASQFDPSNVATVYRELGDRLRYHDVPDGLFTTVLGLDPAIEDRIARLSSDPSSADKAEQADRNTPTTDGNVTRTTQHDQTRTDRDQDTLSDDGNATQTPRDQRPQTDSNQDSSEARELGTRWRNWLLATTVLTVLSVVTMLIATTTSNGVTTVSGPLPRSGVMLAGLTTFVTWLLIPVFMYMDSEATRSVTDWPNHRLLYLAGAVIPVYNPIVVGVYLWRRPRSTSAGQTAESTE